MCRLCRPCAYVSWCIVWVAGWVWVWVWPSAPLAPPPYVARGRRAWPHPHATGGGLSSSCAGKITAPVFLAPSTDQ